MEQSPAHSIPQVTVGANNQVSACPSRARRHSTACLVLNPHIHAQSLTIALGTANRSWWAAPTRAPTRPSCARGRPTSPRFSETSFSRWSPCCVWPTGHGGRHQSGLRPVQAPRAGARHSGCHARPPERQPDQCGGVQRTQGHPQPHLRRGRPAAGHGVPVRCFPCFRGVRAASPICRLALECCSGKLGGSLVAAALLWLSRRARLAATLPRLPSAVEAGAGKP